MIKNNKDWVYAGVYADKAMTGTKDNREQFQKLIQDCKDGKIDMVLAKSLPRFARNTLDTLKYVRMLRERNIAVYFEVEKINTLKDGEFLLTILSSVAQQEVENTSAYVKKGLKMKMKRGELVGFQGCLGYDYDVVTKSLSINEEGAETVRYIFDRYVAGAGSTMIARELNEQGIPTIKGNPWTSSSVMGIINNEKYIERAEILREKGTNRSQFYRGQVAKYNWVDFGDSYLQSDLNAAYLWAQLQVADEINENRLATWKKYNDAFKVYADEGKVQLPVIPHECEHNAHMFYLKFLNIRDRQNYIRYMKDNDIMCVFHYVPLHSAPAGLKYGRFHGVDTYTTTESDKLVRLPMYYNISEGDICSVIEKTCAFLKSL